MKGRTELPGIVEGQKLLHTPILSRSDSLSLLDYLQGKVKVDEYVTHGFKLAEINDGFDAVHVSGCLFVSGSCLVVFSRAAIASVLSSTCHEFRRKDGEKKLVVLPIEYECSCMVSNSSRTRNVVTVQFTTAATVSEILHTDWTSRLSIHSDGT